MFEFIKAHQDFYRAYLTYSDNSLMNQSDFLNFFRKTKLATKSELGYSESELVYHMAYSAAGINAMSKVWLSTGLKETPSQMADILCDEYRGKSRFIR